MTTDIIISYCGRDQSHVEITFRIFKVYQMTKFSTQFSSTLCFTIWTCQVNCLAILLLQVCFLFPELCSAVESDQTCPRLPENLIQSILHFNLVIRFICNGRTLKMFLDDLLQAPDWTGMISGETTKFERGLGRKSSSLSLPSRL